MINDITVQYSEAEAKQLIKTIVHCINTMRECLDEHTRELESAKELIKFNDEEKAKNRKVDIISELVLEMATKKARRYIDKFPEIKAEHEEAIKLYQSIHTKLKEKVTAELAEK
jgi:hypothetical protein